MLDGCGGGSDDDAIPSGSGAPPLPTAALTAATAGTPAGPGQGGALAATASDAAAPDAASAASPLASSSVQQSAGLQNGAAVGPAAPCDEIPVPNATAVIAPLPGLNGSRQSPASEVTLLLTSRDVFAPTLQYLFGIARTGRGCLVSTFRYFDRALLSRGHCMCGTLLSPLYAYGRFSPDRCPCHWTLAGCFLFTGWKMKRTLLPRSAPTSRATCSASSTAPCLRHDVLPEVRFLHYKALPLLSSFICIE